MGRIRIGETGAAWLYSLMLACLFIFLRGYSFNKGDQAEHLPQVYQLLDPQLYPNDYFVAQANGQFTVREFYVQFVLMIAKTVGLEWGLFLITLLCITTTAFAFNRIAHDVFQSHWATWLAPGFVLFHFYWYTLGGNHITYSTLISSTAAKALACLALMFAIRRNWFFAGALLGVAALFQILVGLQLFLPLTIAAFLMARDSRKPAIIHLWSGFLPIAAIVMVPLSMQVLGQTHEMDMRMYYDVLYAFRNPDHYLPETFPFSHFVQFFRLIAIGVIAYLIVRPADRGFYPIMVAAILFGMLVYTVSINVPELQFVGMSQWFKTSIWVSSFSAMMLAGLVGRILQSFFSSHAVARKVPVISAVSSVLLFLPVVNSAHIPGYPNMRYMIGWRDSTDLEKMHQWIASNTPVDTRVLVSPENTGFACQAKRPMPIHFQAIIHTPEFMLPWYEKMNEVYGVGLEDVGKGNARELASRYYTSRNFKGAGYGIRYRLDNTETCQFLDELGEIVHQQGPWILTEYLSE